MNQENNKPIRFFPTLVMGIFCTLLVLLGCLTLSLGRFRIPEIEEPEDVSIKDSLDRHVASELDEAYQNLLSVPKRFWLGDDVQQAPVPDQSCYGTTNDPSTLGWLLSDAQNLLDGQETVFTTDTQLLPNTSVTYYLDDTILAITWKQPMDYLVYTVSEIKISDPSQFRRHLADNTYASEKRYTTSQMAQAVNAVVGSSADHYLGRDYGIVVYDGQVMRSNFPEIADVCFVDRNGDLHLKRRGEFPDGDSAQKYVDENDINFGLAFGPVLIENGEVATPPSYPIGEINDNYARAALCQVDELHYLVVTANFEPGYNKLCDIHTFAKNLAILGCQKAYTLDGGNTGAIVMNGTLINRTQFGYERTLGDIIYFCTAIPNTNE